MIPKFSNPSLLLESTAITSRAALNGYSDDESEPTQANPEHAKMVARLENILKRSIEAVPPMFPGEGGGEERPRKKKRKKESNEGEREEHTEGGAEAEAVPFRLFSGASGLKAIIFAPKPPPTFVSEGPAREDTAAEAALRAAHAQSTAVDGAWVTAESSRPTILPPRESKRVAELTGKIPADDPTLLVLERPKLPPPKPPRLAQAHPEVVFETYPLGGYADCCLSIQVKDLAREEAAKRKRRRGKQRDRPVVQPMFWRPPPGMGGKALGSAWGYSGSRSLEAGETARYQRDTMKKAECA